MAALLRGALNANCRQREFPFARHTPSETKDDGVRQVSWLVGHNFGAPPSQIRKIQWLWRTSSPHTVAGAARASHPSSLFIPCGEPDAKAMLPKSMNAVNLVPSFMRKWALGLSRECASFVPYFTNP